MRINELRAFFPMSCPILIVKITFSREEVIGSVMVVIIAIVIIAEILAPYLINSRKLMGSLIFLQQVLNQFPVPFLSILSHTLLPLQNCKT